MHRTCWMLQFGHFQFHQGQPCRPTGNVRLKSYSPQHRRPQPKKIRTRSRPARERKWNGITENHLSSTTRWSTTHYTVTHAIEFFFCEQILAAWRLCGRRPTGSRAQVVLPTAVHSRPGVSRRAPRRRSETTRTGRQRRHVGVGRSPRGQSCTRHRGGSSSRAGDRSRCRRCWRLCGRYPAGRAGGDASASGRHSVYGRRLFGSHGAGEWGAGRWKRRIRVESLVVFLYSGSGLSCSYRGVFPHVPNSSIIETSKLNWYFYLLFFWKLYVGILEANQLYLV